MATFVAFDQFVEDLGKGVHDLSADTLKVMLTDTTPVPGSDVVFADITEITAGNGYTAGGTAVGTLAFSQTSGVAKLTGDDVPFTASGGSIAQFRYAVLYNATPTSPLKPLIGYWDYGAEQIVTDTNSFVVDFDDVTRLIAQITTA